MNPTSLVTGANGYTGMMLSQYLAGKGIPTRGMYYAPDGAPDFSHQNIELVPGDVRERDSIRRAMEGIDTVYHLAALYRPVNVTNQDYRDVNITGTKNVLEIAADAKVKRFVHCSTIGVHGHVENPPAGESAPIKPDDYYQETKWEGEVLAREYGPKLGLKLAVIRPAAIYGPGEKRFLKLAQLIQQGRFWMFGNGDILYHFINIEDLCDAFLKCATMEEAIGNVYIIADDHAITLNDILRIFGEAVGTPPPTMRWPLWMLMSVSTVIELACKPFKIQPPLHRRRAEWFWSVRCFDISAARRDIGYDPKVAIEDGLKEMIASYRKAGWIK
jgi:nucleoside-diphosphate-sugar epimerase